MTTAAEGWIAQTHLRQEVMSSYRQRFESHPARLFVIDDFLKSDKAERLAHYLKNDVEYEVKHGLYSVEEPVSQEVWRSGEPHDRFFRYSQPVRVRPEAQLGETTLTYMQFRAAFADPTFMAYFERVTGLRLSYSREEIGAHAMQEGDYMRSHDDDNRDRQLALILYLSPDWKPEYGGALRMTDRNGKVTVITPKFNSLAMFDVLAGSTHEVMPVTAAANGAVRRTIGGWYHRA